MNSAPGTISRRRFCHATLAAAALAAGLSRTGWASSYVDYFRAVKINNVRTVRSLLERGFDPNTIEPERGESGLMLAIRENAPDVIDLLLQAQGIDLNQRAFNGDTALMIASYKGDRRAVEALLARGALVHHEGWTPLHYAASGGHEEIARLLLARGAQLDARSPNNTTPMMMAALGGHIMMVKLLLDAGADATLKNDHGMTAIDFAREAERTEIVEGLTWRLRRAGKL